MLAPYIIAFAIPLPFSDDPLVKKLTVMGSIGNIQGISKAANPPNKPAIKMAHNDGVLVFPVVCFVTCLVIFSTLACCACTFFTADEDELASLNSTPEVEMVSWAIACDTGPISIKTMKMMNDNFFIINF